MICAMLAFNHGRKLTLALIFILLGGCFGSQHQVLTKKIRVVTEPIDGWVWQTDTTGRRNLGRAPITVEQKYTVITRTYKRWWTYLWLLGSGGATAGGYLMLTGTEDDGIQVGGATLLIAGGIAAIGALTGVLVGEFNPEIKTVTGEQITVGASAPEHLDAWHKLPTPYEPAELKLSLTPGGQKKTRMAGILGVLKDPTPSKRSTHRPVVAVFDIQDAARRFKRSNLDQLTDYLAAQLTAEAGFRVVPRQQLRERLAQEKREGYKSCFDEACQIELGKAVAAERSLATKLLKVGEACAITAVLYDLKSETSLLAASTETTCSTSALMGGVRELAKKLARSR